MRANLNLTGGELVLLYVATGNEDAGRIIREAARQEREFNEASSGKLGKRKGFIYLTPTRE